MKKNKYELPGTEEIFRLINAITDDYRVKNNIQPYASNPEIHSDGMELETEHPGRVPGGKEDIDSQREK